MLLIGVLGLFRSSNLGNFPLNFGGWKYALIVAPSSEDIYNNL